MRPDAGNDTFDQAGSTPRNQLPGQGRRGGGGGLLISVKKDIDYDQSVPKRGSREATSVTAKVQLTGPGQGSGLGLFSTPGPPPVVSPCGYCPQGFALFES